MEDEQPKLEDALAEVEAQCKTIIKEAKDKLQAVMTQIRDLVYQVKRGEKEVDLPGGVNGSHGPVRPLPVLRLDRREIPVVPG
jgi:hypothetical protein